MRTIYDYWRKIIADSTRDFMRVVEAGVHDGSSTNNLLVCGAVAGKAVGWIGLEPDPRSVAVCREMGLPVIEAAASDREGEAELWLSSGFTPGCEGRFHTDSSSLQTPAEHLKRHPWCQFASKVTVKTVRIDDLVPPDEHIDLLWADVQGAQRKLIAGAREVLARTDYLYIECHRAPLYEGEPTFAELCLLLPDWQVWRQWDDDVLFRRTK